MTTPEELREKAALYRQMVHAFTRALFVEALNELADEYEATAVEMEQEEGGPVPL